MKKKLLLVTGLILALLLMQAVGQPTQSQSLLTSTKASFDASLTRQAPTPIVNVTYGTVESDYGMEVVECSTSGFALAGYTNSYGASCSDGWLIRTDQNGIPLWNYTYGGDSSDYFNSLIECSDGGFALVGYTYSYDVTQDAFWLVRVDANGNHLWNETYDTPYSDTAWEVVEVSSGGFAIVGHTHLSPNSDEFWLVRTDSSGNHLWNETYGGPYSDEAYSLIEVSTGGFLLTGRTESFGSGTPTSPSRAIAMANLWAVRTNATGFALWNRTYGDLDWEEACNVVECPGGDFAFAGYIFTLFTGNRDFWLLRTDNTGVHLWNETYGYSDCEEEATDMIIYSSGGFVLVGTTNDTTHGDDDIWLVRVDASGNQIWNESFGSSHTDRCYGLADCSLGIALYAKSMTTSYDYQGWLIVIPDDVAPAWNPTPADQTVLYGVPFSYDLNATDGQGLDAWVLNDTTNFAIDSDGVVTNAVPIAVGTYGLKVDVSDPAGNTLSGTFKVIVIQAPQVPWLLYIGIAVVAILVVCLIIYFIRRSRKSK